MLPSELDHHSEALVLREEALLRSVRLPPDLNLQRRTDLNVPNPVGFAAPTRADNHLMGFRVMPQDHRNGRVELAGLPSRMDQEQERVAEKPAPSPAIQRQRQSENRERETTRLPAKAEEWLRSPADSVRLEALHANTSAP
jgi:hypothetical protein